MNWLLRIFMTLILVLALAFGTLTFIWIHPEFILTDARVNSLFDQYAGSFFSKRPEQIRLVLTPYGFFGKHLRLEAKSFCWKDPDACFKSFEIELAFKLIALKKVKIEEIGPLELLGEHITYSVTHSKQDAENTTSNSSIRNFVEIPSNLIVNDVLIDLPKILILDGKTQISGESHIRGKASDQLKITAHAKSNDGLIGSLVVGTGFSLTQENAFDANLHVKDNVSIDGRLLGTVNWQKLQGSVKGSLSVTHILPWLNTVYVKNLQLDRIDGKAHLEADVETKLDQTLASDHSKSVLPRVKLDALVHGKLNLEEDHGDTKYLIKLGPARDMGIELEALVSGKFPIPDEENYRFGIEKISATLSIPSFHEFVKKLEQTNYSVPAPFSSLQGPIHLRIGNNESTIENDTVPLNLSTELDSTQQSLKSKSTAKINFSKESKKILITGESQIHDLKFTLPDLKILEPAPLIKNDPRLVQSATPSPSPTSKRVEKSSVVQIEWKVRTDPEAIKIYHSILKPYAPFEVSWDLSSRDSQGSIELKPFEIEYLNRVAKVKTLRFFQNPGDTKFRYEGKLLIVKTDYTITVDIIQDGEKPKIVLASEPPLNQSDIISVLLFNQTTAELDSDQTNSVASTQSAITNRALGLFSILALSSTPVEAVNFNPSTGIYSARVKLANGLTATVGTDWDRNQEVALRKRLGKNFVLSTILESDPETNNETRKTLIEWFKRF